MSPQSGSAQNEMSFLAGGGEMGERIRTLDWSQTPLGSTDSWPQSLRSAVSILLPSKAQIAMFWGPELITLYNDAYRPVLGTKHPWALGLPVRDVWSELWGVGLKELFEGVLDTGEAYWASDRPFMMERYGFPEETYFDISYDPVRDETGRVGGLFCIVSDTTARVVGERRLETLRRLSATASAEANSVEVACGAAAKILAASQQDLPFALIYLIEESVEQARLAAACGLVPGSAAAPITIDLNDHSRESAAWPLHSVIQRNFRYELTDLLSRFGRLPGGAWPEAPHTAVILPVRLSNPDRIAGFLIAGVSPRRPLDDQYRGFFDLLASQIATIVANARAYEQERKRAESLAELDRAKTAFFSNVSHEFRTPLTLILSPLEEVLSNDGDQPVSRCREPLEIAHRNSLRLQKLVNTLLDFSRIEAGRVQASYESTDLAILTADLASNFRSACERAGVELVVDCHPLTEPVYVDRDMWEKVVLNLVSNAFKFTLEGRIVVCLRETPGGIELTVRDTGCGIPASEVPRLFERFRRVEGAHGRTHEGSGIGLALVRELVKLHGGEVRVKSSYGQGSVFTVALPFGTAHLPADRIHADRTLTSTALGAAPYVEEALRWLPASPGSAKDSLPAIAAHAGHGAILSDRTPAADSRDRYRILLADDNADMREYVRHLLGQRFHVDAVADGEAAWQAAQVTSPDLVLADVMMPRLSGFDLLQRIRSDQRLQQVPVILLSARAGEESRVEGMEAGADDYLIKPFSARELLARVDAHINMANLRRESQKALRESEEHLRAIVATTPACIKLVAADGTLLDMNAAGLAMVEADQPEDVTGRSVYALICDEHREAFRAFNERICRGDKGSLEFEILGLRGTRRWVETHAAPLRGPGGDFRQLSITHDITTRKQADESIRTLNARLASDVEIMTRMHQVSTRLTQAEDFELLLSEILDAAIEITSSDMGNIQLLAGDALKIAVQRGFERPFLDFFDCVHDGSAACGTAMQSGGRIVVDDVANSSIFAATPALGVMLDAGARAVQSTPLISRAGRVVGMLSTHWRHAPHRPSEQELFMLDLLARQATDLIERRQAEEALRESEQRYRLLFESMDEGYCLIEVLFDELDRPIDYRFLDINPAFERQTGLKDAAGKLMRELAPQHEQHWFDIYGRIARSGETLRFENQAAALGRWYDVCAFRIGPPELRRVGIVFNDITERRRSQESLREADRRKDEFLATLAHELRNPLAPIRNALQLMRLARGDLATADEACSIMERQLQQMVRLVDDLLDASRISRNKLELRKERVELRAVLESALETSRPLIKSAGHFLRTTLPPNPIFLEADSVRLAQVFSNLLNNSAKYTEANGTIDLTAETSDAEVIVRVRDTGVGIPAEKLRCIFEMFVQVDSSRERAHGGLGIGLTLVKQLVEMHGGSVEVHSNGLGQGSEFTVRLPMLHMPSASEAQLPSNQEPASGARRRIVIADDNRDAASTLALMLKLMGHDVVTAHDGLQAVHEVESFHPDLVLLDIGMPVLNGYDAARRIRQMRDTEQVTLIALTGWAQEEDRRRSKDAGFSDHLVKPVEPTALTRILSRLDGATS
jgi:PAS domain S-box-containing protein